MVDFNKYVGIPYVDHGRDFEGCDCFGLVRLVLALEYKIYLPDWRAVSHDHRGRNKTITNHLHECVYPVDLPDVADIGIFVFDGLPSHLALYIGNDTILHTIQGRETCIERLSSPLLRGRAREWFRINSAYNTKKSF